MPDGRDIAGMCQHFCRLAFVVEESLKSVKEEREKKKAECEQIENQTYKQRKREAEIMARTFNREIQCRESHLT